MIPPAERTDPLPPVPSKEVHEPSRERVWEMFDRIAPRYDLMNRLMTFGLDVRWRRRMARDLPPGEDLAVLDLATGTGDQLLLMMEVEPRIRRAVGIDLAEQMLARGRAKVAARGWGDRIELSVGDAAAIPAADGAFDAVTISFGIRNVVDVGAALREMFRVLRPGGRALILETSQPESGLLRFGHRVYLRRVMPYLGGLVSGDLEAYRYLNRTVETFPCGQAFCARLEAAGFREVAAHPLAFGAATIYRGDRP
jgi:demethylmenaquinone methyltransferase / 2-methoxy-6-polyprenyl-1,4-benzoquinol methylase